MNSYIISLLSLSRECQFLKSRFTYLVLCSTQSAWHTVGAQYTYMSYISILRKMSHSSSCFFYLTYSICYSNKFMLVDLYQCILQFDNFYNSSIPSNFVSSQPLTSKCLPTASTKKHTVCKNFAPLFAVS